MNPRPDDLRSAFDRLLQSTKPLDGLESLIWRCLTAAVDVPDHPWNLGGLVTLTQVQEPAGETLSSVYRVVPTARTVVVRAVNRQQRTLDCYTDRRSQKALDLLHDRSVAWLFYEASTKIQLRVAAKGELIEQGEEVDAAWSGTPLRSRSAYASKQRPGARLVGDEIPNVSDRNVDQSCPEKGRDHFCIFRSTVDSIDWLYLRDGGHVRAQVKFTRSGDSQVTWLNP
ncbi:MAG: pyridoxamine 5'-phosphate oxidase family protein [Planctomycetota bacterium]